MGLFEKAGRRFEQFKKEAEDAAEEEAEYGCTACETLLYTPHDECPECGADAVVSLETGDSTHGGDGEPGDGSPGSPSGESADGETGERPADGESDPADRERPG